MCGYRNTLPLDFVAVFTHTLPVLRVSVALHCSLGVNEGRTDIDSPYHALYSITQPTVISLLYSLIPSLVLLSQKARIAYKQHPHV